MARLDETRLVGVIEAVFSLELDDHDWLYQVLSALASLCRAEHQYLGFFYDASDSHDIKLWNVCAPPSSAELAAGFEQLRGKLGPEFARTILRSQHVASARRTGMSELRGLLSQLEQSGWGDALLVNGVDPAGVGCCLLIGCRAHEFEPSPAELFVHRCVAANLSAAFRCRRQLAISRARSESGPALAARVSGGNGVASLTGRERQIVARATLGFTNKQIAYDLGISDATVRVLMARAASRIGVRTRRELLAHPSLQELFPVATVAEPRHRQVEESMEAVPASAP